AAVATLSPRQQLSGLPLRVLSANQLNPSYAPSPAEMCELFSNAGLTVDDQHRVRRPVWTQLLSDLITVGVKS
ncbi:SAM-dependent methyltransferase, partial [Mycobacterium sp. ITM-2017-0098]